MPDLYTKLEEHLLQKNMDERQKIADLEQRVNELLNALKDEHARSFTSSLASGGSVCRVTDCDVCQLIAKAGAE